MQERQAVARLKRGDIGGLEWLVTHYQLQAVRAAFLVTHDRALAEQVVQDAFVRAYERIHQFDERRPFAPWFMRIVLNDAIKATQRQQRMVSLDNDETGNAEPRFQQLLADGDADPAVLVEAAEQRAAVWAALEQLSPSQRAAIVQRYYLDMSEAEMAAAVQRPVGTIKWRLHAARQRLRTLLIR